jgi:hypothetical protein
MGGDGTIYLSADVIYAVNPVTGARLWEAAHCKPTTPLVISRNESRAVFLVVGDLSHKNMP